MWKAAFTGRSEKGGDRDRDTTSASGKSEARRKKSSRSSRGDVDDTASVMSGASRRHRSSRHESSSRYGDGDDRVKYSSRYEDDDRDRVKNSSRYEDNDRDRVQDSSYYSGGPPSVYGSAVSYASPGSGSYATAPTSRVTAETRPLTASALRMLPDDDGDEDEWEDDEKTVKSERRRKKRSPSDEREKRRKSSGREKERKRSPSRERKDKTRSSTAEKSKDKSSSGRSEPELVTDSSRAIPAMGSFEQFPGQFGGGVMGQQQHQQPEYTMSGALPNVVPQSQFPGQDHPAPYEQPAPPMGISRADSYGHAADYYLDEGQSVAFQPGFRTSTPNMLVNPDHHLMAASSVAQPAQDTGHGSAADFYNDTTSFPAPITPARPTAKPGKPASSSASKPSKTSRPSRTSSGSAVAAGLAGVAGAAAVNKIGKNGKTSSSHHHSQSEYSTSTSYQQQYGSRPGDCPPTLPSMTSLSRPSRHSSDGNVYYTTQGLGSNGAGASITGSSAYGPNYENTYGTGNVSGKTTNYSNAGIYQAGAAAAGAAAYGIYQTQHKHGRNDSNMAVAGDLGGNGQGPPRSPRPAGFSGGYYPPNGNSGGGMMQQGHYHEHKGPMTKLKDGLLNLISTPEDVAKMEMYTEYIGVCKYCFDPRTSAWDAPRVHHYHKRRDSFESLRRRLSKDRLQHKPSYERVDKESRYYASDSSRRRREEKHSSMGLAGAGLAGVGAGLAANTLFNGGKNFDDTYSVQSGHRESSAVRRRSRSSSREKRRQSQHGTTWPGHDEFANVTIRKKDGTIEHRRMARSRSGSGGRKSGLGLGTAVAASAALGAAGLAASARHRSRSSSRENRRRTDRVSSGQSDFTRYERDDRRQSEEGGGGMFSNFFSPPGKQRRNSREHQKKRAGFFTFSNGSASSSNSDLAFGGSALSRKGSKASLSRRSSGRSTRGRPRRKSSDQQLAATLAGIGATAAALSAAKAGHRITKRTSRPELGARRNVKQHVIDDHRHGSPGSSDEDGWEDELPSDDASSNDGLAFGDYGGKHLTGRQSLESVASQSSAGGLGAWGWRWGGKDKKRKSQRSTSGKLPYPATDYGSTIGPIGAGLAAGAAAGSVFDTSRPVQPHQTVYLDDTGRPLPSVDARSSTSGASSQPLQYIDPKPVSDAGTPQQQSIPGVFETPTRVHSMPGAFEAEDPPIYRPGPGVVQHPQPMSPARPAFTQPGADAGYTATVGVTDGRPTPRRTQSSPVQSTWGQDAALIGAGVLGAGAIIAGSALSSGRKSRDSQSNVRFGLTEEQERKENRSGRQEDKKIDEERRRADRTRALKEEAERAAKESRQEEVLRAREAENTARAQAQLHLQREQERKAAEEARILAEKRAHEQRERQWEIERLEKEAADRQAAAAAATAEFERQRLAREEAERRQAEIEREAREREEALRRQQYELAEEARREDEQRRQWDAERYAREYQTSARNGSVRDYREDSRGRRNDDIGRKQSSGWTAAAAGAAAAAGVGTIIADSEEKKRRQSGKSDSTDDYPVSRRPPRTSVDWNADAFAEDREAAEQAELDLQARNQYGQASRGSVERKHGYAATEIKPGSTEHGEPIMDDDIFNPDFFMQAQDSPADRARHEELARKAADKVVAEPARAYSPDNRPRENYADFFADEIKDVLAKKPGEKERRIQPDSDVQVYHVEEDGAVPPFTLRNDFGGKSKHAPYGVPRLNVIGPTPPPGSRTTSTKGSVPSSPSSKAADAGAERSPDSGKDSKSDRSRSISWGEDEINVYDVQTPDSFQEKDRESYITSPDLGSIGKGVAAAAGVAGAAVTGAALHDIVVEDGDKTKTYKDEDFTPASSKNSKKDKKKSKKGSKSNADDADSSFLDELSNKAKASSSYEDVPPERGTEVPYKETESSRPRKEDERNRQIVDVEEIARTPVGESPGTLPHPIYQQPFLDSVSDFSGFRSVASPGTEGVPPVRGFIEGEVKETTAAEEKRPHIPGEFDDEQNDSTIATSHGVPSEDTTSQVPLSKKEKKKREKEAKRTGSGTFDISEPSTPVKDREEPVAEPPLSAKEKKKREKEAKRASSGSFDVEPVSNAVEPEEFVSEPPLSAKEKKQREKEAKRASVTFDTDPVTTSITGEAEVDAWEPPLSAKERKKREKAAKKAGIDPAYSEETTPIVESPKADIEEADEYFPGMSSKEQKVSQFEDGLRRIASTQSAISMPSWSGDTVVSDVTAKPPSPELSRSEQRKAEKQGKKSAFSFADVTDTILASGGVAAAAAALNDGADDSGPGSSKKDKKKKRKSKLGESTYDDPRDAPSGMPGGWDTPERKSSPESADHAKEITDDAPSGRPRENELPQSAQEPVPAQETDPNSEWFESTPSSKKNKKKSKRSSVAFDSTPQVSSPLRSEVAWDDYVGMNGDKAESEAARSDPITVIERRTNDDTKNSRQSSTQDEYFDAGPRVSESPRDMSPEDARSVNSADADKESRRKSRREEARRNSDYYEQPQYAYETQSAISSEHADGDDRKKHKRRSRHEDDDTVSVSSSRRRSRHLDDDDDTRSVTSSRSRREKEESPTAKKEKKGIFGSLFGRKSSETVPTVKDSREDDDEDRRRRKKKHRESDYGDEDDDARSVKSESHRRRHRSTDEKDDNDSRERRRRSAHEDDDKYSESGSRHHRRRRTDESGESLSRHRSHESKSEHGDRPKHHRRRTDEDNHESRDQSFLGSRVEDLPPLPVSRPGSPDTAVEWKEGRPLEAGSGTGLVSAAAAGLAVGVAASALSRSKKAKKGGKNTRDEVRNQPEEQYVEQPEYAGPLPSTAAHSFPLPYVPEHEEVRAVLEEDDSAPQTPAPVLEKPARPVSIGRPGSSTAVPLRLPGHAPTTPGGKERAKSFSSPLTTAPGASSLTSPATPGSARSRQSRPHSSELKSGIMPLYLVERSRPVQEVEETLPSLPSSKPSSRASSVHGSDEYESAREDFSVANSVTSSPDRTRGRSLTLDTISANNFRAEGDILGSEQTTPKASEWPQTAIPWALSTPSGERKEKQQPQFYTWEDFAQDERMHEQERGDDVDAATTIAPAGSALVDAPRGRSASPFKAQALAAAAMLGTAAVYASHQSNEKSPERIAEAKQDEPLPSAAAHSFPLPYLPTPEPEEISQQNPSAEAESAAKLEEAFDEPVSTSKKSKKKGKKQQAAGVETPEQSASPADATPGISVEPTLQRDDAQDAVLFPSAAAHTIPVVPAIEFTDPSPEKEKALEGFTQADVPQSDAGHFASAAAHSMPIYDPVETSRDVKDPEPPSEPYQLPGLKAEPAPLVIEQRNVQVEPRAETVEVNSAPQLTRKQSKKDKKKAKRTSIFEDEPKPLAEESPVTEPASLPSSVQDTDRGTKDANAAAAFSFGLSDFGAVAAGGAIGWGLSQADAFRKSMQKLQDSRLTSEDGARTLADEEPAKPSEPVVDKPAEAIEEVLEPISTKTSKKGKKRSKQSSICEALPEVEQKSGETQDLEKSIDPTNFAQEPADAAQDAQPGAVQDIQAEPVNADTLVVADDWAPPSTSKKKSKKDKQKRLSTPFEPEAEVPQAETADQHDSTERGDVTNVPQADSTQTEEKPYDQPLTIVDAPKSSESSPAPLPGAETSQADIKDGLAAVEGGNWFEEPDEFGTTTANAVEAGITEVEPVEDLFPELSTKKSKKKQKKQKALAEEALAETGSKDEQQSQPEAVQESIKEQDPPIEQPSAAEPVPEETFPESSASTADVMATVEDVTSTFSKKKKSKKEKRKSKNVFLDEAEKPAEDVPSPDANADDAKIVDTSDQQEPVAAEVAATVDATKQDVIVPESDVAAAAVDDFAPAPSKKKNKKDKRKSKNVALDEPDEIVAKSDANLEAPKLEEVGGGEADPQIETAAPDGSGDSSLDLDGGQAVDATEPSAGVLEVKPDVQTEATPSDSIPDQTLVETVEISKDQSEEPVSAQAPLAEDDFSQLSSKKKGKKKKQKQLESSWEPDQAEPTIPVEMPAEAAPDTEKSAEEASSNTDAPATGAVAASVFTSYEDSPAPEKAEPAPEKTAEPEAADDIWEAPVSKKKSKKDKRKSKTFDLGEPQQAISEPATQDEDHDAPIKEEPQTADLAAGTSTERDAQAADLPSNQPVEEEKPTLSRKQSKKDKKKRESLALQVEEEPKVETDPSVETLEADAGTVPAASDPAGEVVHQAEREAADEVPQPTETPDDSFHDAEDFFEARPVADSWHDAEEAALPAEALPSEPTPTSDSFKDAARATDKEHDTASSAPLNAEPAQESWADMIDDAATIIADTDELSTQQNNLVDDVFGVVSDSADFSADAGKAADQEEIMPDRGAEFEPERVSEDMDAFGDPTPKDPAEWSLGTSKKSGKKGKKGKKSVSKAPIMPEPATSSAPESFTQLETTADPAKAEILPEREEIDKTTSLGAGDAPAEPSVGLLENASQAKDVSDESPAPDDKEIANEEQIITAETSADVQPTFDDATNAIADAETGNDLPPAEVDEISWPTTSKKKKGKKGKKSQQSDDTVPETMTREVADDTLELVEEAAIAEQPETMVTEPVAVRTPEVDSEAFREQETTTPTTNEPEDFTAAPLSKKKAKKANRLGSQTPQTIDEPSTVDDSISQIPDPDQAQIEKTEALEAPTEDAGKESIDLAAEVIAPSDDHGAPRGPTEASNAKYEDVVEVIPEPTHLDQDEFKLDSGSPAPELDTPVEPTTSSDQQDTAVQGEEADFSWAPSSKKGKKGKKNKKSVTDIPSSNEEKSLDQSADPKVDEPPAESSMAAALAAGGAAVAAGLLAGSTLHETSVEPETPTPTQEATDDFAWPTTSKKKGKKGKKGSKSGFDAVAEPEIAKDEPEAQPDKMEPLESTGEATSNIEPEPAQESLEPALEPFPEAARDVVADETSTPVNEATADDVAWTSGSKKKGKKSKKGSKTVLETPATENKDERIEQQPDTTVLPETSADAVHITEDTAVEASIQPATDSLADRALDALADPSVAAPLEPTIEASTEETAGKVTVDAADSTPLESSTQPPTEEPEDLWGTFTSSKKKKGKKGRKSGAVEIDDPKVEESSSLQADEKTEDAAAGNNEPAVHIAEHPGDDQPPTEETLVVPEPSAAEPVQAEDDSWAVPTSSKKKKGKKGKKADILDDDAVHIAENPGDDQPPTEETLVVPEPSAAEPVQAEDDSWAVPTSSKKKKGKKGKKADVTDVDEPKIDESISSETIEKAEDASAEPAGKQADEPLLEEETSAVPAPLTFEPTETADDLWANPTIGSKKKGKKGKKADVLDVDEPKIDELISSETIEKAEDASAELAGKKADKPLLEEETLAVPAPLTFEPTETADDLWATPTTGSKKKGKKGKKSGTATPAAEEVEQPLEPPQAIEHKELFASEPLPAKDITERSILEQVEESGAVDFDMERGDNTNHSGSITSAEVKDAVLEHYVTEQPKDELVIEKPEASIAASIEAEPGSSNDLAEEVSQEADDWSAPPTSKKQKKKGKKNKSSVTETAGESVTEPTRDIETSELPPPEEVRSVEDVASAEEQPAPLTEPVESANVGAAQESQAADTDDFFTSSSRSSKKKGKKGKKSKQVSLDETQVIVDDGANVEEVSRIDQQEELKPEAQPNSEVDPVLPAHETIDTIMHTGETKAEILQPNATATDTAVTETIDLDLSAEVPTREEPTEALPAEETTATKAIGEDIVLPESAASTDIAPETQVVDAPAQEAEELFPTSSGKKGNKGKKGKHSISEETSEPNESAPKEVVQDESVPQSTGTTSQEATEAESEDVWALPVKGKKGKKAKKLQQLAAENLQTESQAESLESRLETDTSTSDPQPSTETDADDLWATPSTGKKNKKGKKGKRDSELAHEKPSDVMVDLPAKDNSVQASTGLEATEPSDDQNAPQEVTVGPEIERIHEEPIKDSLEPGTDEAKKTEHEDGVDLTEAAEGAVAAAAAIAVATASKEDKGSAVTSSDVYDWGAVSTKKSKKDKKKARKSGTATPATTVDDVGQAEQAAEDGMASRTIEDTMDITSDRTPVVEGAAVSEQRLDDAREIPASLEPTVPTGNELELAHEVSNADVDFTATVAAGLADSGFNPDMVINDPAFQRRASPTRVAEADPEEDVFSTTVSKRKKGKKGQTNSETPPVEAVESISDQPKTDSDVDDILNKTLASTGFDATLLEKAVAASNEQPSAEVEPESEFAFTTTKRKKGKKSKKAAVTEDEEVNKVAEQPQPADIPDPAGDTSAEAPREEPTDAPKTTTESNEHSWMVQDEMDVDAMDNAYRAYKKNKRQQKKLRAKSGAISDNPESTAVDDTERSALISEAEDTSARAVTKSTHEDMSTGQDEDQPTVRSPGSATSSGSIVQSVFPGLERIKRRVPHAGTNADGKAQEGRASNDPEPRGLMHTSEVSQNLPTEVPQSPTSPTRSKDQSSSWPAIATGIAAAGTGIANAARQDKASSQEHGPPSQESSWSFAALRGGDQAFVDPSTQDRAVRDSGYETAKRSSHQTDRSSAEVPQIVRTSSSRDSLLQRRSLEPMRVSTPTSPDWEIHTAKQRRGDDSARDISHHERKLSDNTPLEPTNAALSPSQMLEQPSPSPKPSTRHQNSTNDGRAPSSPAPVEHSPALSWDGNRDGSAFSPTWPRTPPDAIAEEQSRRQRSRKRSKARAEVGGPENIKAVRRTETPQAIRAQEEALAPSDRRHGSQRSVSSPTSTSDEVFNRLPWPAVDQENERVQMDRSRPPRHGPPPAMTTPDVRSASVLSDRSNVSGNHFRSPHELRSYSRNSNSSSTPSLRRTSLSGDLRAASKRGGSDLGSLNGSLAGSAVGARASPQSIAFEPPPTPPLEHDELTHHGGASRAMDTSDDVFVSEGVSAAVYARNTDSAQQGYGDAQRSQVSPTRPPSVRKRQSMHINDLETRLDMLVAENRALQEARQASEGARGLDDGSLQEALEARDLQLQAKHAEINQIKAMLQPLQDEVARLTELNNGLAEANRNLVDDTNGRYATLQAEHAEAHSKWLETSQELESIRSEHGRITSGMRDIVEAEIASSLADKNAEILRLREQLDIAAEQIRALQVQIQSSKSTDFLVQRDEDYFDGACQKLCQHVQQWVLRFSKMSDNRVCRLSTDLNDDKIEARLDNAVLDGSDVDKLLGDRVRRRDVFMSVVMTMVWEYIFTRYLFGMDREQRQKLKALEKLLAEVGPPRAVAHWRATTLTLLSKRPQFDAQCALDTEAVAHEIFEILCMLLPPPSSSRSQLQASLQKVLRIAVDLAIEMRTQRAEFIMLPPLQPEYDTNGDLVRKVYFNSSLMNERSGLFSSNEELAAKHAVVKIVLFPLVVKKGDDVGEGDDEIVVCPAQVLVHNDGGRDKKIVRVMSGAMEIDEPIRSRQSNRSLLSEAQGGSGF